MNLRTEKQHATPEEQHARPTHAVQTSKVMPIQIVNSGVKLGSDPNTSTTVVFRNEGGVVCLLTDNLAGQRNKTKNFSFRGPTDASDGGIVLSASDRHTPLAIAHLGDGEGGNSSSPSDMSSVFGLKVLRLNAEELAAEEQTKGQNKASAVQTSAQPKTGGANGRDRDGPNPSAEPGTDEEGADTFPAEVWMTPAVRRSQKWLPARATLTERVRHGNDLVKAVRAGRSFRKATVGSVKGALELGLWAANRPDEYVRTNQAFQRHCNKRPQGKATNSPGQAFRAAANKSYVSAEGGGADSSSNSSRAQIGSAGGGDVGGVGLGDDDRVRVLEAKLRNVEEKLAGARRRTPGGGEGSRQEGRGTNSSGYMSYQRSVTTLVVASALHMSHGSGAGPGCREGRTPPTSTTTGTVPRIAGLPGAAAAAAGVTDGRAGAKPQKSTGGQEEGVGLPWEGLEQGTPPRAIAGAGEGKKGTSRHQPGGPHTARSAPATTGRERSSRPHGHPNNSGSMSARRVAPGGSATSVEASASAQKELKAAMKAYLQRQVSLDDALSESITQRDFDWDADMRRMMNTIKFAAAGEGKRTFGSVPKAMRRQVATKRRSEEARSLQGSWFPSVMKRMLTMVQGKEGGKMPECMIKLAAALSKVLVSGHTVEPYVFWSLVDASYLPDDHQRAFSQKMILTCLSSVQQRPENYYRFLVDNGIKVPTSLKQSFQRAHQKRRKGGSKKPQLAGGSVNRLSGVVAGGGGDHHGGALDDRSSSIVSMLGGGLRYGGGGGASTANLSDGGGSDDMSDTMSVFSVSTQLEGN